MKNALICLSLVLCSVAPAYGTEVQVFDLRTDVSVINPAHGGALSYGSIQFDDQQILLEVNFQMPRCPKTELCAQVMPQPINIQAEVASVRKEGCSVDYIGTAVDGEKVTTIKISDYSHTLCRMRLIAPVAVTYITVTKNQKEVISKLYFIKNEEGGSGDFLHLNQRL